MINIKYRIVIITLFLFQYIQLYSQIDLETAHHKYHVIQAWNIVRYLHPEVINSEMQNRMQFSPETYGDWQNNQYDGDFPWQVGKIITGAFREDQEDVVYGYLWPMVTATHFWVSDCTEQGGDTWKFEGPWPYGNYENAYVKASAMWNGEYTKDNEENGALMVGPFPGIQGNPDFSVKLQYNDLAYAYKNHQNIKITHIHYGGVWTKLSEKPIFISYILENSTFTQSEIDELIDKIIWETVGRIAHLIGDMGVPAHTHGSPHTEEIYEKTYLPTYYDRWGWYQGIEQAAQLGQFPIINFNNVYNPIRCVMYLTNQAADRFAGNKKTPLTNLEIIFGNGNYLEKNNTSYFNHILLPYYQSITTTAGPSVIDYDYCTAVANKSFIFSFRSTAGFLWYVYNQFFSQTPTQPLVVEITEPYSYKNNPKPIFLTSIPYTFQCKFKILRENDNRTYEFKIYFTQDGQMLKINEGDGIYANTDISVPCTINSTNGPCINRPAGILISANPVNDPEDIAYYESIIQPFYPTDVICNSNLRSATNGTDINLGNLSAFFMPLKGCESSFFGQHYCQRHKITKVINHSSNQKVVVDPLLSLGYNYSILQNMIISNGGNYANIENQTPTSTRVYTYVYYITDLQKWVPCPPEEATIVYHLEEGNYQPIISGFTPAPPIVYQNQPRTFTCILKQGTSPVTYNWHWNCTPSDATTITANGNQITIQYHFEPTYPVTAWVEAVNSYGHYYGYINFVHSSNKGCPWLFVEDAESILQEDNNLLHKSKFPENIGQDITDRYVLSKSPGIVDSTLTLCLGETLSDTSFINNIKLYAVDHPIGTKLCVTEDNQLAIFDSASVISVEEAYLNDTDITESIQFHYSPKSIIRCDSMDHANSQFPSNTTGNAIIAVYRFKPNAIAYAKNIDGFLTANVNEEQFTSYFSRRENKSITAIPLNNYEGLPTIQDVNIDYYKGNEIRYIAIANLLYSGFTITELQFLSAYNNPSEGEPTIDEIYKVIELDSLYSKIDFSNSLTMKFKAIALESSTTQMVRDYVIEVNGRIGSYLNPLKKEKINKLKTNKPLNSLVPFKNKLNHNYPNPFNPVTKISYSIEKQGLVNLKIYDILGREIKTLVKEIKSPGEYIVEFNGSNLASGVYFYRLEVNGFIDVKKMMLIK